MSKGDPAKQVVPRVYADAVSPAAKRVGQTLARVVHTSLRPVDGIVWTVDKALDWVSQRVTALLASDKVKAKDVQAPAIEIEGRIVTSLQTAGPGDEVLRNMFAGLLGSAMTKATAKKVHPAFVEMLRQMTPLEARLFALICATPSPKIVKGQATAYWRVEKLWSNGKRSESVVPVPGTKKVERLWPNMWERYSLEVSEVTAVDDALLNLERLGVVVQRHVAALADFEPKELHAPWFESVRAWIEDFSKFHEKGPGRPLPSPNEDLGWERLEIGSGLVTYLVSDNSVKAKRSAAGVKKLSFKPYNTIELMICEATRWGEKLGRACRTADFVQNDRVTVPEWGD